MCSITFGESDLQRESRKPLLEMYRIHRFSSGVTVVTAEMPHMASVSLGIWVGVGGRYEPEPLCGVSHFIEHMLFKGTRRRTSHQISQDVEGVGGYLNAFTTEENTCFYSKAQADRLPELWDVLSDMFLHSKFDEGEIEKERNVIKEELAMYLDQPHQHVQELLDETLWPDQPLGRSLTGTDRTLNLMRRAHLLDYFDANYVSRSTLISGAGNLRHAESVKIVAPFARKLARKPRPTFAPVRISQTAPRLRLFTKDTEQTQISLGLRACSRHDVKRYALRLLDAILGENTSSRLFQIVREDHGLAYSIYSSPTFFEDAGMLAVSAGVETRRLSKALKLIIKELVRFTRVPPTAGEVRRARDYVIGQIDLGLENTENQMMWAGEQLLAYGQVLLPSEVKRRLGEVTPSQIRAVAREYFHPNRASLALVSPLKNVSSLERLLRWQAG